MNLSALNSGLSPAANPVSTELNNLGGALSRPSSGLQTGEEFAAFLRHQIASLQSPQRQEIAADSAPRLADSATNSPKKGVFEQQALRQAFHPGQFLHRNTPSSKGMGSPSLGGHSAKALISPRSVTVNSHAVHAEQHAAAEPQQANRAANDKAQQANESENHTDREQAQNVDASHAAKAHAKAQAQQDHQDLQSIALSPEVEIITVAQPATSEKSLTDFALAMGLDPSQVQALLGDAGSAASATPPTTSTQQILAMNSLPSMTPGNTPSGSGLSLSSTGVNGFNPLANATPLNLGSDGQALPTSAVLAQPLPVALGATAMANVTPLPTDAMPLTPMGLQVQWSAASADTAADKAFNPLPAVSIADVAQTVESPDNISTLAVLSMMDADLRPEDIDRLKNEFDKLSAMDDSATSTHDGMTDTGLNNARSSNASSNATAAQALKNHPDMAQTFEKLSQKLATELASRLNDQLNAGEWKMKFALKPASLGLVDVQLEMRDGQLSAQFQADNGLTQNLIQNGSTRLKEALAELGMNNAYVFVGQDNRQSSQGGSGQSASRQASPDNRVTLGNSNAGEQQDSATVTARHSNSALFDTFA
jgi:hypothetical protein